MKEVTIKEQINHIFQIIGEELNIPNLLTRKDYWSLSLDNKKVFNDVLEYKFNEKKGLFKTSFQIAIEELNKSLEKKYGIKRMISNSREFLSFINNDYSYINNLSSKDKLALFKELNNPTIREDVPGMPIFRKGKSEEEEPIENKPNELEEHREVIGKHVKKEELPNVDIGFKDEEEIEESVESSQIEEDETDIYSDFETEEEVEEPIENKPNELEEHREIIGKHVKKEKLPNVNIGFKDEEEVEESVESSQIEEDETDIYLDFEDEEEEPIENKPNELDEPVEVIGKHVKKEELPNVDIGVKDEEEIEESVESSQIEDETDIYLDFEEEEEPIETVENNNEAEEIIVKLINKDTEKAKYLSDEIIECENMIKMLENYLISSKTEKGKKRCEQIISSRKKELAKLKKRYELIKLKTIKEQLIEIREQLINIFTNVEDVDNNKNLIINLSFTITHIELCLNYFNQVNKGLMSKEDLMVELNMTFRLINNVINEANSKGYAK